MSVGSDDERTIHFGVENRDVARFLREFNPSDVGHEDLPDGSVLRVEGFTDECWQEHVERFGDEAEAGVAIVEREILSDWQKRHPGMKIVAFDWIGAPSPWEECIFWAHLVPDGTIANEEAQGEKI